MKAYVASTLSNADEARSIADALGLDGWEIAYRWWEHGSVQGDGDDRIREVAHAELHGVLGATLSIIVDHGVPVFFCGDRQLACRFVEGLLCRYHRKVAVGGHG